VSVQEQLVAEIGPGYLLLVGVGRADPDAHVAKLADKVAGLRVFPDDEGKEPLARTSAARRPRRRSSRRAATEAGARRGSPRTERADAMVEAFAPHRGHGSGSAGAAGAHGVEPRTTDR
jgi:hypothetical protein